MEDRTRLDVCGFISDYDEACFGNDGISRLKTWLTSKRTPASMVNGVLRQLASISEMIFDVPSPVSYVSHFLKLLLGAIVSTGTPAGVGWA